MELDFTQAFKYTFKDQKWPTKLLVTAAISMVPILSFAVIGYEVEIIRNIWAGNPYPLPKWDNLQSKFTLGLPVGILTLGVVIPIVIISLVLFFAAYLTTFFAIFSAASGSSNQGWPGSGMALLASGGILFVFFAILIVLGLLWTLLYPAIILRYAKTGDWHSFLEIGRLFQFVRARLGRYLLAVLAVLVASWVSGFAIFFVAIPSMMIPIAGNLASLIAGLFFGTLLRFFTAHIYAQVVME